jgi:hypothetical protein
MKRNENSRAYCSTTIASKQEATDFRKKIIKLGNANEDDDVIKALLKYINVLHKTIIHNKKSYRESKEHLDMILNDLETSIQ